MTSLLGVTHVTPSNVHFKPKNIKSVVGDKSVGVTRVTLAAPVKLLLCFMLMGLSGKQWITLQPKHNPDVF